MASSPTKRSSRDHRAWGEGKGWAGLVREDDYPINIEGAAFRENGTLLLGLRFPTTAEGRPILVELEGIDRLFDPDGDLPEVRGFWTVDAVGKGGEIAGVRDLALLTAVCISSEPARE